MNSNKSPNVIDALKIFAIFLIFSLAMSLVSGIFMESSPKTPLGLLYALFFSHVLGIIAPVIVYIYSKGYSFKETLNLRPVALSSLLFISLASLVFFVMLHVLQGFMEPLFKPYAEGMTDYQNFFTGLASASRSPINVFLLLLGVGIIPAVAEEILFRGIILTGLRNSSTAARAIVLSGLLFGIIHVFPPQVISVSLLGMFFGILLVRTHSIITTIWCHFLNNTLIISIILITQLKN
ncbi:MAG TPA: type II CAAX endopeptidase family protein [Planctomycetota bacterium]|nr:type II CAAX endopeptidase family protein [Planctomycetota bacterium]